MALDSAGYFPEAKKEALRVQGLNWLHAAGSLMDSDVEIVLDAFNGGVSVLWASAMDESRFATLPAYDVFLKTLAKNIRQVSLGVEGASRRVYSITNTENSQSMGFHWVAIVYSIRKKTQAELVAERQAQALDHLGHPPTRPKQDRRQVLHKQGQLRGLRDLPHRPRPELLLRWTATWPKLCGLCFVFFRRRLRCWASRRRYLHFQERVFSPKLRYSPSSA